ncbi:MAG: DivIVA domain-containing protein [Clostridia bacterium]|nr:DivIVA domain-containing protein [Clostridia bacterium]
MSVITPKDLAGKSFSSAFKGYNKTEVDEYVAKVTKNYSVLYRRCAELEESLAVANVRLENIVIYERRAKKTLESAKEKSDCMIAEAYERADDILVAIKKNCDAILRDFRRKVDIQKDALAEMHARVEYFKKDVFAKYKSHIEMLESLSPPFEFDEEYTSNEYVMRVINELKHEITAEYDISVGDDDEESTNPFSQFFEEPDFDEMPTEEEISAFINDLTKQALPEAEAPAAPVTVAEPLQQILPPEEITPTPVEAEKAKEPAQAVLTPEILEIMAENREKPTGAEAEPKEEAKAAAEKTEEAPPPAEKDATAEEAAMLGAEEQEGFIPKDDEETRVIIPSNIRSTRKKKKQLKSVLDMLREYEEDDARKIPKIEAQLMFNFDEASDSLMESPKK